MEDLKKDIEKAIALAKPLPFDIKEETWKVIYVHGEERGAYKGNGRLKLFALKEVGFTNLEEALTRHL